MSHRDSAWLAGLLEGEGCFYLHRHRNRPSWRAQIMVELKMTDEDVVRRASGLMGASVYVCPDPRPNSRDCYRATVNGYRAEALMRTVLPHMGSRRSAKIRECLGATNLSHHPKAQKAGEVTS